MPQRSAVWRVRFLVDSGAVYSVLRREDWRTLRLSHVRQLDFVLANGTSLTRGVSECVFEIDGRRATSPVVLGETEDEALLGAVTLETLGLVLNPLSRTLQPMRMVLAANLLLTVLANAGVREETLGDSTAALDLRPTA